MFKKTINRIILFSLLLFSCMSLSIALPFLPAFAQEKAAQTEAIAADQPEDHTLFYAFLKEEPGALHGPLIDLLRDRPLFKGFIKPESNLERKFRPMLQWRLWADSKQAPVASFLFIMLVLFLSWYLLPSLLQEASNESKKHFWACFGHGVLLAAVWMLITRSVFLSQLGWPLGILMSGLAQAAMLLGLSVAVFNLGHSVCRLLKLQNLPLLAKDASCLRSAEIILGSILAALILQIPGAGLMPRCGTRLLALFALLGAGALFRTIKKRQNN